MKIRNLLANKNVVTILGAILIVVVLYAFYNWRVNQAVNPVRIPYAITTIGPRTKITAEMIGYVDVQELSIKGDIYKNANDVVDLYTNVNTIVPAGSFFYKTAVVEFRYLPDAWTLDIPDDMVAYAAKVNVISTYGNSIYPGNYIDVYFKGVDNDKVIVGKLISNVKVAAVKDGNGNNVFENLDENRTPSLVIFPVSEEMNTVLRTAENIRNAELILVPTSLSYKDNLDEVVTEMSDDEIKAYIEANRA